MSQPSISWWQKYGTLAQMAQAAVALLGFVAILFESAYLATYGTDSQEWLKARLAQFNPEQRKALLVAADLMSALVDESA